MIRFEINHMGQWEVEQGIMNSNPAYNRLSKDKETVEYDDIYSEHTEAVKRGYYPPPYYKGQ